MRDLRSMSFAVLLSVFAAAAAGAQQSAIVGTITDRGTGTPVSDANVTLVGTQRGTRTGQDGKFRLPSVAAGTYSVRVSRLGYGAATRPVTVPATGDVTLDIQLSVSAATIEEVVVTATGQSERKRENGNDVGIIKPGQTMSLAATPTITNLLTAKTPGLTITQNMGSVGTSARIRIRGSNSVSLSNEPLLIVDGVRVNNDVNASSLGVGGATTSRFDDFNPEDIENIEVLKGPAASALYGTAAANGVIQITTKRGRAGAAAWRSNAQYGGMTDPTDYPDNYYTSGLAGTTGNVFFAACTLDKAARSLCRRDQLFQFNPIKYYNVQGTGHTQDLGLSVSGGSDVAQYFISGDVQRQQGLADPNKVRGESGRANINAQMRPNLTTQVTANYIDRQIRLPYNDNNIFGVVPNGVLGHAGNCAPGVTPNPVPCAGDTLSRGFYSRVPSTFYYITNQTLTRRFVGGDNTTWQPLAWLSVVGQAGLDFENTTDEVLTPANVVTDVNQGLIDGSRRRRANTNTNYSVNGSATASRSLLADLQSQTSIGTQYINEQRHYTEGQGRQLVSGTGSLATVSAGKDVAESNQTIVTVGGYARQQFAWRDRAFLTGSIRADENSAFGKNFKLAYYPAASLSWVVSEEPFLRDRNLIADGWVNQLRVRASYGQSGQRPGFRQSDTYFNGAAVADRSAELTAVAIGGAGNPELKPEITSEHELGFDASFWNNRIGLTYTYYSKVTRDALIAQTLAPSLGEAPTATPTRFVNLGRVSNSGNEITLDATAIDQPNLKLELNFSGSTPKNRLDRLGENIPTIVFNGARQRQQEGYSLGSFFQRKFTFEDKNHDGVISRVGCTAVLTGPPNDPACEIVLGDTASAAQYIGPVLPTRELAFMPALTLFKNVRLAALVQHRGGNYVYNNTEEFRCTSSAFTNCRGVNDPNSPLPLQAAAIGYLLSGSGPGGNSSFGYIEKGDFTKLREVSATFSVPKRYIGFARAQAMNLTVAGRNLHTWTKYRGFDPEVNASVANFTQFDFLTQPALRSWNVRLDLSF